MKWNNVRLGSYCSKIGSGATPKGGSKVYKKNGTTLIRSQNIYNLTFSSDGLTHITDGAAQKLNNVSIEENDILLNITGDSVARTCVVPKEILPARVNQHVSIIRPVPEKLNYKYLNYFLASPFMQSYMLNLAVGKGASRNALTKSMIENFTVPLPPLIIQIKIANILSVYDDLIENNQKQIKLLEEAAMMLYKEWFVNLRFPGYETTKIVDGVPEGWKRSTFKSLCELIKDSIKLGHINDDISYIGLEHIPRKSICLNKWGSSSDVNSDKYRYQKKDILFGKIRPYFHKVGFAINDGVCSTDAMVFRAKENYFGLLLTTAFSDEFVANSYATCREGAKMPRADWNEMGNYPVLIPHGKTLLVFNSITNDFFDLITNKHKQNHNLSEARDKLLPKLMNGEIDIPEE